MDHDVLGEATRRSVSQRRPDGVVAQVRVSIDAIGASPATAHGTHGDPLPHAHVDEIRAYGSDRSCNLVPHHLSAFDVMPVRERRQVGPADTARIDPNEHIPGP